MIARAGGEKSSSSGDSDSQCRQALEQLCGEYWYPLYAFLRQRGYASDQAEDITQGFFASLLDGKFFQDADPDVGRFRTFLLTALQRYAGHQRQRDQAQKRGGHLRQLSIDATDGERRFGREPVVDATPESMFQRQWALTVLQRALQSVENYYSDAGKSHLFAALKYHLDGGEPTSHAEVAERLEMTEGAVKAAAHRLRERYRQAVRDEVAGTLASDQEVDEEIRQLMEAVRSR